MVVGILTVGNECVSLSIRRTMNAKDVNERRKLGIIFWVGVFSVDWALFFVRLGNYQSAVLVKCRLLDF